LGLLRIASLSFFAGELSLDAVVGTQAESLIEFLRVQLLLLEIAVGITRPSGKKDLLAQVVPSFMKMTFSYGIPHSASLAM
jgi:hypothetical protein